MVIGMMFTTFLVYSQTRKERIKAARVQMSTLLTSYANGPYEVGEIVDVDSSLGVRGVANGKISNPYGTLNRCYLFTAKVQGEDGKHIIGVYRDNQIVWISDQLSGSQNYGDLDEGFLATKDLNRMSKVDVAVYFSDGMNPPSEYYLWIFSWDGSQGVCINQQESDGRTSMVSSGAFDIYDVDGDGKDEILSYGSDHKVNATYSWNGNLYGEWTSSPNLTGKSHTIANNLTAIVHAVVQREGDKLRYSYEVTNDKSSQQKIESFYVQTAIDTIDSVKVPLGWKGGQWAGYPLANCFTESENNQIDTGHTLKPFSFNCSGLPTISAYYVQGPNHTLDYSKISTELNPDTLMLMTYRNVLNNSFIGKTVGPKILQAQFVPIKIINDITGYISKSHSLGWIKDRATENKYINYLSKARKNLQQNDIGKAREILHQVLQEANADRTKLMVSEACDLIRYNTEYLLEKLSAK
jgi:hypothetical protein